MKRTRRAVVQLVGEDAAVLRDQDRHVAVVVAQPDEEFGEGRRLNRRAGVGARDPVGAAVGRRHVVGDEHLPRVRRAARDSSDRAAGVVVDAEVVGRRRDRLEVAGADEVELADEALVPATHVLRVRASEDRVEEPAVDVAVGGPRRLPVGRRSRSPGSAARARARSRSRPSRPERRNSCDRAAMGEEDVVKGGRLATDIVLVAGRVEAVQVAEQADDPRLVDREPGADAVAVGLEAGRGELGETLGRVAGEPAALVLERLRELPVVERHDRLDTAVEQRVDEARVVIAASRLERRPAGREEAGPRDREAVRAEAELAHQLDVLGPTAIVVAGDVARAAALDPAGEMRERVPDRRALAVRVRRTLDLVRRRRRAPEEARRERPHSPSSSASSQASKRTPTLQACDRVSSMPFAWKQSVW